MLHSVAVKFGKLPTMSEATHYVVPLRVIICFYIPPLALSLLLVTPGLAKQARAGLLRGGGHREIK